MTPVVETAEAFPSEVPPSASPSASASPLPTVTASPTPTPITRGSEAISAGNAGQIQDLRRWGAGDGPDSGRLGLTAGV
jgi:hypothetical protein